MEQLTVQPVQSYPNIAWGAVSKEGKLVGHRDWKEVVVMHSDGHCVCAIPELSSATHFVWAGDSSEFAYVCDDDQIAVFKRNKSTTFTDVSPDEKTCAPLSLCYVSNASGSSHSLMFETRSINLRGKPDTFTLVGQHDAELHISGACADNMCIYGIDTVETRLIGHKHVRTSQFYLFDGHPDDARPDHCRCATDGKHVAVVGDTTFRLYDNYTSETREIRWQVPATVIGVPFFLSGDYVATLEHNGHGLVIRDVKDGQILKTWGIRFAVRVAMSVGGEFAVFNMGDGSTEVYKAVDLFP